MMVGVLLAGGASTRMGRPKALVKADAESFLARGVRRLWTACDSVVVVLGSGAREVRTKAEREFEQLVSSGRLQDDLRQAHGHGAAELELRFVVNPRWKQGMFSSVRCGLEGALDQKPTAAMLMPVDHPSVQPITVASLAGVMLQALAASRRGRERDQFSYALIPRFRAQRGHPIALSPALSRAIVADRAAESLSDAIRRNARMVGYLDVHDRGVVVNRNTAD
jgi:CTP:molybdopterin cytidylyltransferase MocA